MTNDKDSAVLAERVERVTKWLDGGCSTWGTPMQDIREILNALRQPTQSDVLREENGRLREALRRCDEIVKSWNFRQNEKVEDVRFIVRAALQEQSK